MKNFRKALSIFLAALMLCSAFTFGVSAECQHEYEGVYVSADCVNAGYTMYACYLCGDSYADYSDGTPALGHNYGSWTPVDEASCTIEGHEKRDCMRCGASEIKTTSVLPHTDINKDNHCDLCGKELDSNFKVSPFDWLVAFFQAVAQFFRDIFA